MCATSCNILFLKKYCSRNVNLFGLKFKIQIALYKGPYVTYVAERHIYLVWLRWDNLTDPLIESTLMMFL